MASSARPEPDLDPRAYRPRLFGRTTLVVLACFSIACVALGTWLYVARLWMPGRSHRGALPLLTPTERAMSDSLRRDVESLATSVGPRDAEHPAALAAAASFVTQQLVAAGVPTRPVPYTLSNGRTFENIEATQAGTSAPSEIVVVGAHYDSADGFPGADDNASGVAALLDLARRFSHAPPAARTVRWVAFANEEPPFFQEAGMGSLAYARACRSRGERIVAMISLESIGYYSDAQESQHYPFPYALLFPDRGNFVAFVGNPGSAALLRRAIRAFRASGEMPSEGAIIDESTEGAGWSDHWSFWQVGYPAIMVTDTAVFRNANYHHAGDTPDTLQYDRLARAVSGIADIRVQELRSRGGPGRDSS